MKIEPNNIFETIEQCIIEHCRVFGDRPETISISVEHKHEIQRQFIEKTNVNPYLLHFGLTIFGIRVVWHLDNEQEIYCTHAKSAFKFGK